MSGWWPRGRWRSFFRGRLPEHLLVLTGLVAFVGAVYVAVVIVVGLFVGRSDAPSPLLSVAATAIVAVGFEPVRRRLRAWANRLSGRPHPLPYDVLAHFAPDSRGVGAGDADVDGEGSRCRGECPPGPGVAAGRWSNQACCGPPRKRR